VTERTLGSEQPSTFLSLNNLSLILLAQGELPEARQLLERVLGENPAHPEFVRQLTHSPNDKSREAVR
jgi:hypothetical protein